MVGGRRVDGRYSEGKFQEDIVTKQMFKISNHVKKEKGGCARFLGLK